MGFDKLIALWTRVRDSLWFVPALLTVAYAALAFGTVSLDRAGLLANAADGRWLFGGTASGARGVLTAIASGYITVTGVVFSVTIVALQLASTQFTPRILRNFTADRANQVVLGVFIGTFTYSLLVLRVIRAQEDAPAGGAAPAEAFVPNLSVTVSLALAVVGIGFLIFFIDHAARSVQASVIIDRVTGTTLDTLDRRLPSTVGAPAAESPTDVTPRAHGSIVEARKSGYIEGVDADALTRLLRHDKLTVRMERDVGDFVLPGTTLAVVWPAGLADGDVAETIRKAFILGPQRTPHLDVELGLIELVDIAVKALSPGINDPTTATLCVDRIVEVLVEYGRRDPPARVRRDPDGHGILILPRLEFDHLVELGFTQIRHYGSGDARFCATLLHRLEHLGTLLPSGRTRPVARQAAALVREACVRIEEPGDRKAVVRAGRQTLRALGVGSRS